MTAIKSAMNPANKTPIAPMATTSKDVRRMLGLSLHGWENSMVVFLIIAGGFALLAGAATWAVVRLQRIEIAESNDALERYKIEAGATSDRLRNETAKLTADNLALQTVLLPRHAGLIGFNRAPPAAEWFAGIAPYAGTKLLIQYANDKEAGNLAAEISIVVTKFGWTAQVVDEKRTHFSPDQIRDGASVLYPTGKPWSPETQNEPWFAWAKAAQSLSEALTKAGLAVGDRPVSVAGFMPDALSGMLRLTPTFDPPLEGVFLQIGARPVAETVEWIKRGRPDMLGNKPADAAPAEAPK